MLQELRLLRVLHSVLTRLFSDALSAELATYDLSSAQYHALQYIAHSGTQAEECDVSSLAKALGTSVPAATKMADRLQAAGWLERHYAEHDRRHTFLQLTAKGQAVINQLAGCVEATLQPLLQQLTAEEREQLTGGVEAFIGHALKLPALQDTCLYCGESHTADCPLQQD